VSAERKVRFADKNSRIAFETSQKLRDLGELPTKPGDESLVDISFSKKNESRGLQVIYLAGTVLPTGSERIVTVPRRTTRVLGKLKIRFKNISN